MPEGMGTGMGMAGSEDAGAADRAACLGPDGSVAHVTRVLRMIGGRWKLPILFRLFAGPPLRSSQLLKDMPGLSQKVLTEHLRALARDGLVARTDFHERPPRVDYRLTADGVALMPILVAAREFSRRGPRGAGRPDPGGCIAPMG